MAAAPDTTPEGPGSVLVTGGARRIGRAVVVALFEAGWAVVIHHNASAAAAEALADEIAARGGRAAALAADLADEDATADLVDRAAAALGPVTALVNNASIFDRDDPETATRATWDHHMSVNLRAPFVLVQGLLRQIPAEAAGAVVNIVDQRALNPVPGFTTYTLSKMALWDLTRTLALALAPRIRVNAFGPGPVLPSPRQSEADFRRQWQAQPLARAVAPEEIAAAVRFLLDAPSVTGQMITVDAGQHLGWSFPGPGTDINE